MKNIAALLSAAVVLCMPTLTATAEPLNIFGSGVNVLLDGSVIDTADVNLVSNGFSILDHGSLLTITYVTTPTVGLVPGVGILNVTDVCATAALSLGPVNLGTPCKAQALSFTDANFGAVQVGASVALGAQETLIASGNTANLAIAQNASIGLDTASFTFVDPTAAPGANSPVPEPGSLSFMATGLLGAAGALRRKYFV